jgi:hypothetical protein
MKWIDSAVEVLLIGGGLVFVVLVGYRHANKDWQHQLRAVRTLAVLSARSAPWELFDLEEVLLVEPSLSSGTFRVAFAPTDRPYDVAVVLLDEPLGELAERFIDWREQQISLLCSSDGCGGVVLHGPGGWLAGKVVTPAPLVNGLGSPA